MTDSSHKVDRGLTKTLDDRQTAFFNGVSNEKSGDFLHQMLALQGDDGKDYYMNTLTGDIYTKEFVQEGYKDVIAKGRSTVDPATDRVGNIGGALNISQHFKNTGEIKTDAGAGTNWTTSAMVGGSTVNMKFATIKQQIATYNGDMRYISMVKQNGSTEPTADTVNKTGRDLFGRDLFDDGNSGNSASGTAMLNNMLTVYEQTNHSNPHWISSDGVTLADAANQVTLQAHTETGARSRLYTDMTDILTNHKENITKDITDVSSTDVAALATKMMQQQTLMSMSLSMGARILPLSLVDYLR